MMVWCAQEHPSSCVAACLRMVLTSFGQHHAESAIRRLLGKPRFGITLTQAAKRLLAVGAVTQWHVDWGLDDVCHGRMRLWEGRAGILTMRNQHGVVINLQSVQ